MQREDNRFLMITHLSQFASFIFPFGGLIVPIVLWQMKKDEVMNIESHAKEIINFQISFTLYAFMSVFLVLLLIGFGFLIIIGLLGLVFPVIGSIKASDGEFYNYPLTIRFIK